MPDTPYPETSPLLLGQPDGATQPARMIARNWGARTGQDVWVTGTGVSAAVGRWIQLLPGDVTFDQVGDSTGVEVPAPDVVYEADPTPGDWNLTGEVAPEHVDRAHSAAQIMSDPAPKPRARSTRGTTRRKKAPDGMQLRQNDEAGVGGGDPGTQMVRP